jgi:hypothetical protein
LRGHKSNIAQGGIWGRESDGRRDNDGIWP